MAYFWCVQHGKSSIGMSEPKSKRAMKRKHKCRACHSVMTLVKERTDR